MSQVRRVIDSQTAHGRVRVTESGVLQELKLWNANSKNGQTLSFADLLQLKQVMGDWQLLIEEAELLLTRKREHGNDL